MFNPQDINALRYEQEHDEANCVEWWQDASDRDKVLVWEAIQAMGETPLQEIISRFAQLGMTHTALLAESRRVGT